MESLDDTSSGIQRRERPRFVVSAIIVTLVLLAVFVVIQLVSDSRSLRLSRASRQLNALAETKPGLDLARSELARLDLSVSERTQMKDSGVNLTCAVYLSPSRMDFLRMKFHKATGLWSMPTFPAVGEMSFRVSDASTTVSRSKRIRYAITPGKSDGVFAGGKNSVSGTVYKAD